MSKEKTIAIGVCGGIAAYKAADLVSRLVQKGYGVEVIMTAAAKEFISPLTFSTLTGNPVRSTMFQEKAGEKVEHVALADRADLMAVVPATANIIGKAANGIADDLLSTTIMAMDKPVLFFPAMNNKMWENPIQQKNIEKLRENGYEVLNPEEGYLACGDSAKGRLPKIDRIEKMILARLGAPEEKVLPAIPSISAEPGPKEKEKDFSGLRLLVSAGPTREAIDPVRYISNRSSGKMGYALAKAATERGALVYLVSGPVSLDAPPKVHRQMVETAKEMEDAVVHLYPSTDVAIMAAAVADYRPEEIAKEKIKKVGDRLDLPLVRNNDILAFMGRVKKAQVLVGFAAETDHLENHATEKLRRKNLDLIVANDISETGAGFDVDTNIVQLYYPNGKCEKLPLLDKEVLAHLLLDRILLLLRGRK